jgi:transcriptional regulator with XRE-family HTH domain
MNDLAIGRSLRALRHRLDLRQADVAARAGVSQQLVSRLERGRIGGVATRTIRRVFAALDADVVTVIRWRGGDLDRLLDEGHADIVGRMAELLQSKGWEVLPEATFSEWGERGSIDLLAWHEATRTILIVEVKTEIASAEELMRRHDVKVRLAPTIARERFGQTPVAIGRLLVVTHSPTNRRRVARLHPVLGGAYPNRGRDVRRWIASPHGSIAGLVFVQGSAGAGSRRRRSARVTSAPPPRAG